MKTKYCVKIAKKETKDFDITFPQKLSVKEVETWVDEVKRYLFEDASYSPVQTREKIEGKILDIKTQLQDEYTDFELVEVEESSETSN